MSAEGPSRIARARALRAEMTDAERTLWRRLRSRQISGARFRRQVPLGGYVLDFACFAPKLVVELDGGQHADATHQAHDDARTRWLEAEGFRVLRFWNHEVLGNTDGVVETIAAAVVELGVGGEPG